MLGSLIKAANANLGKNQSKNSYDHNDPRVKNAQKKGANREHLGQQTGQIWTNRLTGPQPNRSDRAIIRAGRGVGELGGIGPNFL